MGNHAKVVGFNFSRNADLSADQGQALCAQRSGACSSRVFNRQPVACQLKANISASDIVDRTCRQHHITCIDEAGPIDGNTKWVSNDQIGFMPGDFHHARQGGSGAASRQHFVQDDRGTRCSTPEIDVMRNGHLRALRAPALHHTGCACCVLVGCACQIGSGVVDDRSGVAVDIELGVLVVRYAIDRCLDIHPTFSDVCTNRGGQGSSDNGGIAARRDYQVRVCSMRRAQQQQGRHGQHRGTLALDGTTRNFAHDDQTTVNFATNNSINFIHNLYLRNPDSARRMCTRCLYYRPP